MQPCGAVPGDRGATRAPLGPEEAAPAAMQAKAALRKTVKAALKALTPAQQEAQSQAICRRLLGCTAFREAQSLGIYLHCARLNEVNTSILLTAALRGEKKVYVPLVLDKQANMTFLHLDSTEAVQEVPPFGILEPSRTYTDGSPREDVLEGGVPLDLVVVPGLAFDYEGRRCGRGGGYYDAFLSRLQQASREAGSEPPWLVALAFQEQLVAEVPVGEHDAPVDVVLTARRAHLCSERARAASGWVETLAIHFF